MRENNGNERSTDRREEEKKEEIKEQLNNIRNTTKTRQTIDRSRKNHHYLELSSVRMGSVV